MTASSENQHSEESSPSFREKQQEKGLFEVRHIWAKKEDHADIKKIAAALDNHKTKIMLFLNSLE